MKNSNRKNLENVNILRYLSWISLPNVKNMFANIRISKSFIDNRVPRKNVISFEF